MGVKETFATYRVLGEVALVDQGVPKGFENTEVGVIPEDWDITPLGAIGKFSKGRGVRRDEASSGDLPCVRYGELYTHHNDIVRKFNSYISQSVASGSAPIKRGDILFAGSGETKEEIGKSVAFLGPEPAYAGSDIVILSPYHNDPAFLGYALNADYVVRQKAAKGQGDAVVHITSNGLSNVVVALPSSIDEQQAIAGTLSETVALIESLQQLIAKKYALKQGAMQALLTGRQRLPGFSQDWEVRKLDDFGDVYGGLSGRAKQDFGHGQGRFLTFTGVMSSVVVDMAKAEPVDVPASESQNEVAKGDLLFNGSSETPQEIGLCAAVGEQVDGVYLNSFCFGYRMQPGAPLDPLYLAYFYRSDAGRELLAPLAQGAIRYNLSKRALLGLEFELPPKEEQTAIATVLSHMDAEIDALEARLAKTRALKAGMMQALLTGRIRLLLHEAA